MYICIYSYKSQSLIKSHELAHIITLHARIKRGGGGGLNPLPLKNHKSIEFLNNTGLENYKATKPALNVGPSWARQRNAI